ncbi:Vacuolar protein-like protein sorting vps16 [Venustampulla echinocandica]|uniref:Probable vacuolar protein sorting-associated protein 16 homolog n=1 Tax=Venustampulla echinocandica TaxID=2656787 RepID=A0A370TVQ9_9HELO|nr:Vacuolar protein-like protein sorting vps16 [Venustampulla echinocandica]RDL39558.1 Vacuolar protein-like protein sorting vps16 [Venustampulla echinocandica]
MANPTADWERVGDKFYRKIQLYTAIFDQDLELENYVVTGCSYGGAIALYRDESKLHTFRGTQSSKSSIDLYSCAGKLIRRINWDKGSIKGLGWSEDEKLIVVTADGTVRCYYDLQGDFTQFSLGNGAEEYGVRACRFYGSGFVALLSNNQLVSVTRYEEPRPKLLASPPEGDVHSWTLIPPAYTLSRSVEALLSIGQTIYVVDATESEDRFLDIGPFTHISVSPNGKFAALYTQSGQAYVITSDFQNRLSEHDSKSKIPPKDVQWCGNDAVVIAWEDEVHIIGPNNAAAKYFYDGRVHLIADHDGVRLLTNDVCDFLQKVPEVTDEVFRFGTESPASILLDAVEQLENQSPKADDNIQLIRPNLVEAVDTCVKAAGQEFSIHWQKQLLKAASFGKSVLDIYNSDDFVDMCETLRVLNAVRFYEIGIPLSYEQFLRLTPEKLVQRLINRREYLLALRISTYLRLPTDRIYVHWASQKVRVGTEDENTICRLIVEKLSGKRGISFEEIARAAYDEGRGRLATELLNHEPRAGKQVPLLLSMEEDEIALDKAIESGDSDLVLFVLLHLKKKLPLASFFRVINSRPVATALIESSAQVDDTELLKDLYYQDDRRIDGANVFVREALKQQDSRTATDKLALAGKLLSDSKDSSVALKALQEASSLLRMQEIFDRDLTESFTGLSVNETMFKLIRLGYASRAKKIQNEFKVPERISWWIRLRALVSKRDWAELEEWSKTRKSPIGWEPFFALILSAGNPKLASTFIPKAAPSLQPSDVINMYEKCGMRVKAAEEAVKIKDAETVDRLRNAAGMGTVEGREIESLGAALKR